jgi:hypothetical protein
MATARRAMLGEIATHQAVAAGLIARGGDASKVRNPWSLAVPTAGPVDKAENELRWRAYLLGLKRGWR